MKALSRTQQLFILGVGLATAAGLVFFLVRGTVLRIKDRRERINFGLRRSSPNEIQ
jgi:hypothetical protein